MKCKKKTLYWKKGKIETNPKNLGLNRSTRIKNKPKCVFVEFILPIPGFFMCEHYGSETEVGKIMAPLIANIPRTEKSIPVS